MTSPSRGEGLTDSRRGFALRALPQLCTAAATASSPFRLRARGARAHAVPTDPNAGEHRGAADTTLGAARRPPLRASPRFIEHYLRTSGRGRPRQPRPMGDRRDVHSRRSSRAEARDAARRQAASRRSPFTPAHLASPARHRAGALGAAARPHRARDRATRSEMQAADPTDADDSTLAELLETDTAGLELMHGDVRRRSPTTSFATRHPAALSPDRHRAHERPGRAWTSPTMTVVRSSAASISRRLKGHRRAADAAAAGSAADRRADRLFDRWVAEGFPP